MNSRISELEIKLHKVQDKNSELKKEFKKSKTNSDQIIKERENNISKINQENKILKQKLKTLENELTQKNNELKEKENTITKLKEEISKLQSENKKLKNENIEFQNYIMNNKCNNLNENSIISSREGEKIISVLFMSQGSQDIFNYSMACKTTDLFVRLEERLYNDYPKFKDFEVTFKVNTSPIKRFKTIEENKIRNNDIISLYFFD